MADSEAIITLGIGATPKLTWFILSGLTVPSVSGAAAITLDAVTLSGTGAAYIASAIALTLFARSTGLTLDSGHDAALTLFDRSVTLTVEDRAQ